MIEFFQNNYQWMFSGVGAGFIFWILGYKQGYSKATNLNLKVGDNSSAIQVGGNMNGNIDKG